MNITPPDNPDNPDETDEPVAAVDPLDERLSAALDGNADPEPQPVDPSDEARVAARLRALEAGRDLLAIPPPPLDDLTRRRMLRAAIAATGSRSKRRDLRWLNRTGIAAALLALVVLAGWGLKSLDVNSSESRSAGKAASSATTRPTAAAPSVLPDLHEVSDPTVLERRVEAALVAQERSGAAARLGTRKPAPDTLSSTTLGGNANEQDVCVSTVPVPAGVTPGLLGTATFHDEPALVIVARDQSRTLVFVVARSDCRRLTSQLINH
jgi:hypothetical protein